MKYFFRVASKSPLFNLFPGKVIETSSANETLTSLNIYLHNQSRQDQSNIHSDISTVSLYIYFLKKQTKKKKLSLDQTLQRHSPLESRSLLLCHSRSHCPKQARARVSLFHAFTRCSWRGDFKLSVGQSLVAAVGNVTSVMLGHHSYGSPFLNIQFSISSF